MTVAVVGGPGWSRPRLVVLTGPVTGGRGGGGRRAASSTLRRLAPFVDLVPGSLGADPADPRGHGSRDTGRDCGADGILLTGGSPGLSALLMDRHPGIPFADEEGLCRTEARQHFLAWLFATARLRALPPTLAALGRFHAENKLLLLAHSEVAMRELGRVVANPGGRPGVVVKRRYRAGFARALARPAKAGGLVNALQHGFGHVSGVLKREERDSFLALLEAIGAGRTGPEPAVARLRTWAGRHGREWVRSQSLLCPYPAQ